MVEPSTGQVESWAGLKCSMSDVNGNEDEADHVDDDEAEEPSVEPQEEPSVSSR